MKFSGLTALAICLSIASASPISPPNFLKRDSDSVTTSQLTNFELFAQYAGAAYCTNVVNATSTSLITCEVDGGSCAEVESAKAFLFDSFFELGSQLTTGYVGIDPTNELIIVAFEGTPGFDSSQLLDDMEITRDTTDICGTANTNDGCEIHHGFLACWNDAESVVASALKSAVAAYPSYGIVFTGHSLGGAIAAIGAAVQRNAGYTIDLYTFGQPRIGSADISTYITNQAPALGNNYRVTDYNDEVPQLPPHESMIGKEWDHLTPEYWITINGTDITETDIHVIDTPLFSTTGNSGFSLLDSSMATHREYFGRISACN